MQRNRENAQLSRQRKKQQMAELEARCATLSQHNTKLTVAVQRLTAENAMLRQQLALICQQAGRNAAAAQKPGPAAKPAKPGSPAAAPATAPAAPKPAAAAAAGPKPAAQPATPAAAAAGPAARPAAAAAAAGPAGSATAAAAAAVAARGLLPQWPLLPFGFLPKAALPGQLQAARSAAAKPAAVQQRPAAPAQAAAPMPAPAQAAPAAPAGGRAPKRARTAAGASTAFLALFTLFMFAGPLAPAPGATPAAPGSAATVASAGAQRSLQALPDAALVPEAGAALRGPGRGLQALPATRSAGPQQGPLPRHLALPGGTDGQLSPAAGGRHLQQLLNSTLQALLLEPGNAALEEAALQRLQELGPVALLLDADAPGGAAGANPLAASAAFPTLAGAAACPCTVLAYWGPWPGSTAGNASCSWLCLLLLAEPLPLPWPTLPSHSLRPPSAGQLFGSAGLEVPGMCQKVLEFDAASVPHAARSRRSLERYVLGATGFRGRSLGGAAAGGGAAALPAARGDAALASQPLRQAQPALRISEDDGPGEEGATGEGPGAAGPAGGAVLPTDSAAGGPVLVSVLLPANASGGGNGSAGGGGGHKLAAVDKVFVVLLHPAERYTTYSCALPRPVVL